MTRLVLQAILLVQVMSAPLCTTAWGSTIHGKLTQMLGQFCSAPRYSIAGIASEFALLRDAKTSLCEKVQLQQQQQNLPFLQRCWTKF